MRGWLLRAALAIFAIGVGLRIASELAERRRAACWEDARADCATRCAVPLEDKLRADPQARASIEDARRAGGDPSHVDAGLGVGYAIGTMMDPDTRACIEACARRRARIAECGDPSD